MGGLANVCAALLFVVLILSTLVASGGAEGESSSWLHGLLLAWFAVQAPGRFCWFRALVFCCAYQPGGDMLCPHS